MEPFAEALRRRPWLVLDGGLATELERRGADLSDPLWSARLLADDPGAILAVHRAYREAGADILTTAGYQATLERFERRGFSASEARGFLARSVALAREAAGDGAYVAASLGAYGASLADGSEYRGDYAIGEEALLAWHAGRLLAILPAAPDLLAFETIPSLAEARTIARWMRGGAGVPAYVSFSCRDGRRLCDGTPLREAAALLDSCEGVVALGVNCVPPALVPPLLREAREGTAKPLVAYPNSGERWDAEARAWRGGRNAVDFGRAAEEWVSLGAKIVGGCCRTGPEEIRRITSALRARRSP